MVLQVFSFGEETTTPIQIQKANIRCASIPVLQRSLVTVSLCIVNDQVQGRDISGKLRLDLPDDSASCKSFQVRRDGQWYPATAVPKRKSAAVVYKEKEKNRNVAAVSTSSSGNTFEIEISPLGYQVPVDCRLEILIDTNHVDNLIDTLITKDSSTIVTIETQESSSPECNSAAAVDSSAAIVGEAFGNTHFVCRVPTMDVAKNASSYNTIKRLMILWDTSSSMIGMNLQNRLTALKEIVEAGKIDTVELCTFGNGDPKAVGTFNGTGTDLLQALKSIQDYDGGTDLSVLSKFFSELAKREEDQVNCVLLFTDGMDNIGQKVVVPDSCHVQFPVHCVADANSISLRSLRSLAATSPVYPGTIFTKKDTSYLEGVLIRRTYLRSIKTDQSQEAFLEEIDDGFRCSFDHRLAALNEPIGNDGLIISGILGQPQSNCKQVSKLVAEVVSSDGKVHEYCFQLSTEEEKYLNGNNRLCNGSENNVVRYRNLPTSWTQSPETSRALGHVYAEECYGAAERFGLKSGMDMEAIQQDLAVTYGFCTPESSLLMLYSADQFLDHGIQPPVGHPAREDPRLAAITGQIIDKKRENGTSFDGSGIGGLKTEEMKKTVVELASKLQTYFATPYVLPAPPKQSGFLRQSFGLQNFAAAPAYSPEMGSTEECMDFDEEEEVGGFLRQSFGLQNFAAAPAYSPEMGSTEECMDFDEEEEVRGYLRQSFGLQNFAAAPAYSPEMGSTEECMDFDEEEEVGECGGRGGRGGRCSEWTDFGDEEEAEECMDFIDDDDCGVQMHQLDTALRTRRESRRERCAVPRQIRQNGAPSLGSGIADKNDRAINPVVDMAQYLEKLEKAGPDWKVVYNDELAQLGGHLAASPSFFFNSARVLVNKEKPFDAIRVATNCLESGIEDVQMLRSVGYMLLSTSCGYGLDLSIAVFDKVRELSPCEPQSYLDSALTRFFRTWKLVSDGSCQQKDKSRPELDISTAQSLLVHVLTHRWADRFEEVEWPVLLLLHYIADLIDDLRRGMIDSLDVNDWPIELDGFNGSSNEHPLRCQDFNLPLMVWLGWDTDKTDIDLHVKEPSGQEVHYCNKRGCGSLLSRDFTQGYGPEVYILKDDKLPKQVGEYQVMAKYYASHQDSTLTGATSAVVWTIEKRSGKSFINFNFVRLQTNKEKTLVAKVRVEKSDG